MIESTLPIYPFDVRGTVRHILILKDFLMLSSRLLERYCHIGGLAGRQLSREYIISEINRGQIQQEALLKELSDYKKINKKFYTKIVSLRKEMHNRYRSTILPKSVQIESNCYRIRNERTNFVVDRESCVDIYYNSSKQYPEMPEPFKCQNVKTVLEFLKELFLIQLHFHVVLCQGLNFALPILTGDLDLIDRLLFWPERPEFGLLNRKVMMADKLRDIQVELQRIVEELVSACLLVEAKYLYDQKLEAYFHQYIDLICKRKIEIHEAIQWEKELYDIHQLEHSRLLGCIVKIDPKFAYNYKTKNFPLNYFRPATPRHFIKSKKILYRGKSTENVMRFLSMRTSDAPSADLAEVMPIKNPIKLDFKGGKSKLLERKLNILPNISDKDMNPNNNMEGNTNSINSRSSNKTGKKNCNNNDAPSSVITAADDDEISKTIESLIKMSQSFTFTLDKSPKLESEIKSRRCLSKMVYCVESIIENDWKDVKSRRQID